MGDESSLEWREHRHRERMASRWKIGPASVAAVGKMLSFVRREPGASARRPHDCATPWRPRSRVAEPPAAVCSQGFMAWFLPNNRHLTPLLEPSMTEFSRELSGGRQLLGKAPLPQSCSERLTASPLPSRPRAPSTKPRSPPDSWPCSTASRPAARSSFSPPSRKVIFLVRFSRCLRLRSNSLKFAREDHS